MGSWSPATTSGKVEDEHMRIGAVVQSNQIVPIIAGPTIRIQDTETCEVTEQPNPAWRLERNRRPTAARALIAAGVDVIVAPPHSFCSPSHALVRQAGVRFWPVGNDVDWDALWAAHRHSANYELVSHLPRRDLLKQDASSLLHYARLALRDWSAARRKRAGRAGTLAAAGTRAQRSRVPGQDEPLQEDRQPIG
jgi:hypothetical protein